MGPLDALWHLLNFATVPLLLGAIAAGGAKLAWRRELSRVRWSLLARDAGLAALAVALAGLVISGRDGRMATYGAMVLASAAALWWRGFRRAG